MIELSKLILTKSPSLLITIIIPNSPLNAKQSFSSYISSVSSSFPSITFIFHPIVPLLLGSPSNYADLESIAYETIRSNNTNLHESLKSLSQSSKISAFILDFFCYSAVEVSESFNIPTYFFFASGASCLAFFLNFPVYDKIHADSLKNVKVPLEIPGLFSVPTTHMIECMLDRGYSYNEFIKMAKTMIRSNGIIVNTFESLEVRAIEGLKQGKCVQECSIPPIYCVGPLIANGGGKNGDEGRHECLRWLDTQPSRSVVYLCFGSGGAFSKKQIKEIAFGLEKSGVRFLWVVKNPPNEDEPNLDLILPEGFLDRTKEKGHVVKSWVPQIEVLAHESVGAFVTHCGWNSTLEAVCAGVPLVAWPLYAEQKFNMISLVEEIGIALPMDGSIDGFVSSREIEKRVKQVMSSKEGYAIRKRVLDLKDKARGSLNEGGPSDMALTTLVESMK
ncbi:UDP-glycosyltransferase 88B1 [Bienertia sinuspersici]